jgi:hypothetical protein
MLADAENCPTGRRTTATSGHPAQAAHVPIRRNVWRTLRLFV